MKKSAKVETMVNPDVYQKLLAISGKVGFTPDSLLTNVIIPYGVLNTVNGNVNREMAKA